MQVIGKKRFCGSRSWIPGYEIYVRAQKNRRIDAFFERETKAVDDKRIERFPLCDEDAWSGRSCPRNTQVKMSTF